MVQEGCLIDFGDDSSPSLSKSTASAAGSGAAPATKNFEDNFWGPECRGFEVLMSNLKAESSASHHLAEYLKERLTLEKAYVRGLQKLSKSLAQASDTTLGAFQPLWLVMLKTLEKVSLKKESHINSLSDLCKDVNEYASKQEDQMKGKLKGEIDSAHKSLNNYRHSTEIIRKTRKAYHSSCSDLAEHQKELERARQDPNRGKELEKMEGKIRKLNAHMETAKTEHQKSIKAYHELWKDFEEKMTLACRKFQSLEDHHLNVLRGFLIRLAMAQEEAESQLVKEFKSLKEKIDGMSVEKLLSIFTNIKKTGTMKPELMKFTLVEIDAVQLSHSGSMASISSYTKGTGTPSEVRKVKKKKEKKPKKSAKPPPPQNANSQQTTPEQTPPPNKDENVDEEGFTIRPKDADKIAKFSDEESQGSESDDDSDYDDPDKRIQAVKIKDAPTVVSTVSVDELSKVAKSLKLEAPPLSTGMMRRAGSSHSLDVHSAMSLTPKLRETSPIGSQSLFNQPVDSTPSTPPPFSITAPPTFSTSWEANFDESLPPPMTNNWASFSSSETTPTNTITPDTSVLNSVTPPTIPPTLAPITPPTLLTVVPPTTVAPPTTSEASSLDKGSRENSPKVSAKVNSLLPPPPASSTQRPRVNEGVKSEPTSPMLSLKGVASSSLLGGRRSPRTSSSSLHDSAQLSPSPLATVRQSVGGGSEGGVPIAVAFQETCNAIYKGSDLSKTIVKVTGQLDFSFLASSISSLSSCPPLKFLLKNTEKLTGVLHNQNFITKEGDNVYVFQMSKLVPYLKDQASKNVAPYHNLQALKYEVSVKSSNGLPLQMTSFWKCESSLTTFRLDYTYTPDVFPSTSKPNLTGLAVTVTVGGGVTKSESVPEGAWSASKNVMAWKLPDVEASGNVDTCTLKSKFEVSSGPTSPTPALVHFMCDGSTLSGVAMAIESSAYKISLQKNKCFSGKYMAEPIK